MALILPGRLGKDLIDVLQDADPTLRADCHECILTLRDPILGRQFPRQITIVNLGRLKVTPADLKPTVDINTVSTQVLWVQAWPNKNPEMWHQTACSSTTETRIRICGMLSEVVSSPIKAFDIWGLKFKEGKLFFCLRVSTKDATTLINSKHPFCSADHLSPRDSFTNPKLMLLRFGVPRSKPLLNFDCR